MSETFQVMPPLTPEEYAALRDDIATNGVRVPVDMDQHGRILDGHHRHRVCVELGIPVPTRTVQVTDDAAARDHAYATNTTRRQLDRRQRQESVIRSLLAEPALSDRQHANRCGVSPTTVGTIRRELIGTGLLSKLDTRVDADGKARPIILKSRWPKADPSILATAMDQYGIKSVLPFLALIPSPGMESGEWDLFCDSVHDHGIFMPVRVTADGVLIDGRSRLIAGVITETEVPILVDDLDQGTALGQCLSLNLQQFSWPQGQHRALVAAQLVWREIRAKAGLSGTEAAALDGALWPLFLKAAELRGSEGKDQDSIKVGRLLRLKLGEISDGQSPAGPVLDWIDAYMAHVQAASI